jgi:hypothetical protein
MIPDMPHSPPAGSKKGSTFNELDLVNWTWTRATNGVTGQRSRNMRVGTALLRALVACAIGAWGLAAAAQPAAPPADYEIDPKFAQTSADGAITVEQYVNKDTDDWKWQFWVRRQGTFTLLDPEAAGYPAGFRFTNDLKWIVRFQKTGSGESSLYLYRLTPQGTVPATKKPLSDLAWAYMKTRPEWRRIAKVPEYHESAGLLKGIDDSYRRLGVDWPDNRYLVIGLSGDADVKGRKPMQTSVVNGWRCRYDLETGKFDVPAVFAKDNAKAVVSGGEAD